MAVLEALGKKIYASIDVAFDCGGVGDLYTGIVPVGISVLKRL